ncbi:hypothetical protein NFI96_029002, partial [Prochilodus magdalenae]
LPELLNYLLTSMFHDLIKSLYPDLLASLSPELLGVLGSDLLAFLSIYNYGLFNTDKDILIISTESCVSQSISPLEEKVDAVEGETVTLSCRYDRGGAGTPSLHWYSQYPGTRPEFLLLKFQGSASVTHADPPYPRLHTKDNGSVVNLTISSAAVSDSVLYYCALAPTVTGNPDTLYRNWFCD